MEMAGGTVRVGGAADTGETVTFWLAVATRPRLSRAVQTTMVVPTGKTAGAFPRTSRATPQASTAEAVPMLGTTHELTVTSAGGATVGPGATVTVTCWVRRVTLPN